MSALFDRPVFIMAAPRSCSTLLFQTLCCHPALWSIGDESHHIFEGHPRLCPGFEGLDSNRLTADRLDAGLADALRSALCAELRNARGTPVSDLSPATVRLIEKTPKNALRIPFIDALFPDALFIYLYRDPLRNIASIMQAWQSGFFVTYPGVHTPHGPWSLALPPGWREWRNHPLEEIASFQWMTVNSLIMADLACIDSRRWTAINADELLSDARRAARRLCEFMDIGSDAGFDRTFDRPLPQSRYTVTAPGRDKWRARGAVLAGIVPRMQATVDRINAFVTQAGAMPLGAVEEPGPIEGAGQSRNAPCPCGSGLRYKACHGRVP